MCYLLIFTFISFDQQSFQNSLKKRFLSQNFNTFYKNYLNNNKEIICKIVAEIREGLIVS